MAEYLVQTGQDINSITEKLQHGDIVKIESGEYGGRLIVKVSGITYEALERHNVIFMGQLYFDNNVTNVTIDGFRNQIIEPYSNIDMYKIGMANNIIRNCIVIGDGQGHGGIGFTGLNNIFEHNEVYNTGHGFHHGGADIPDGTIYKGNKIHDLIGHGIGAVGGKNEKAMGNIVYNCKRGDGYGGTGIFYGTASPENIWIEGNLVWGCTNNQIATKGIGTVVIFNTAIGIEVSTSFVYFIESDNPIVKNNIGIRSGVGNAVILIPKIAITDYNDWFNQDEPKCISRYYDKMTLGQYQTYGQGLHSISQDPKFIDILKNDYRLQSDSPCKNAGDDGKDMGCYIIQEEEDMRDIIDINFTAIAKVGSISGNVKKQDETNLAGITIELIGAVIAQVITDADGNYKFLDLIDGNYTVTPKSEDYDFNPTSIDVVISA